MDEYAQEMKNEQVIETVKKAFQKELIVIDALATTKRKLSHRLVSYYWNKDALVKISQKKYLN